LPLETKTQVLVELVVSNQITN